MKRLLSVVLALAVMSQGIARAEEAVAPVEITTVADRAALSAHIDGLAAGDRIVVATDDGLVAGELVERDADDLVIDQPLIQGGADRIVVHRREIQGVRYQQSAPPQTRVAARTLIVVAIAVGAFVIFLRHFAPGP